MKFLNNFLKMVAFVVTSWVVLTGLFCASKFSNFFADDFVKIFIITLVFAVFFYKD